MVTELEKFLRIGAAAHAELFEADEFADAVIDVDDEVADLQIAQVGQKGLRQVAAFFRRTPLFLEDVSLGIHLQRRGAEPEPTRQRADATRPPRVRVLGASTASARCRILQDSGAFGSP